MQEKRYGMPIRLFYSYSHQDEEFRADLEKSLALLKRDGLLHEWHDREILPGQHFNDEIKKNLDISDVVVFFFSRDFFASEACIEEWEYAKGLEYQGKLIVRIPIIARECPWPDFLGDDDVLALPTDGKSITSYPDHEVAWHEIYQGIKSVVENLRNTFKPKVEFLDRINETEFISQQHIKLSELFVFLRLSVIETGGTDQEINESMIANVEELFKSARTLIYGPEKSGKSSLAKYMTLKAVDDNQPVLFIDMHQSDVRTHENFLRRQYEEQFHGDYDIWARQKGKTMILDNMSSSRRNLDFVETFENMFDRVFIMCSLDMFQSFFIDERRLAAYLHMKMLPLTQSQQEHLIRNRLQMSAANRCVDDGLVDRAEDRVNSVIVSDKIFPRYPFYVLSILQTYEGFMPSNMSITSYGNCYQALIVANFVRSGISNTDDDVNTAFNFAEHLAYEVYLSRKGSRDENLDVDKFVELYNQKYFIPNSIVNRMRTGDYRIFDGDSFRTEYMYFFFLGRFLARNPNVGRGIIRSMSENSHAEENYLTLMFTIHHTHDDEIVDDILIRTMLTLDLVEPATLSRDETRRFADVVANLPGDIIEDGDVGTARHKEREHRQRALTDGVDETEEVLDGLEDENPVNGIYRILKSNQIMGQILRTKYGTMKRSKIEEIVEIIADSGLRLVNVALSDEDEIAELAAFMHEKNPKWNIDRLKHGLAFLSFMWTMINIEHVVNVVSVREIREAVDAVVMRKNNAAYDLVGYFNYLSSGGGLNDEVRDELVRLLKKHDDLFVRHVMSIRTQHHMNTHRGPLQIEQSVCSALGIRYYRRMMSDV